MLVSFFNLTLQESAATFNLVVRRRHLLFLEGLEVNTDRVLAVISPSALRASASTRRCFSNRRIRSLPREWLRTPQSFLTHLRRQLLLAVAPNTRISPYGRRPSSHAFGIPLSSTAQTCAKQAFIARRGRSAWTSDRVWQNFRGRFQTPNLKIWAFVRHQDRDAKFYGGRLRCSLASRAPLY